MPIYKFKSKKTGKVVAVPWDGPNPPSQQEIKKIVKSQEKLAARPPYDPGLYEKSKAAIGNVLFKPSEYFTPKPMAQEDVEKLPLGSRVKRIAGEAAAGITHPDTLVKMGTAGAIVGAGALGGPAGLAAAAKVGLPLVFAGDMARHIPAVTKEAIDKPSLETVARAGLTVAGAAGAGRGVYKGLKANVKPSPKISERLLKSGDPGTAKLVAGALKDPDLIAKGKNIAEAGAARKAADLANKKVIPINTKLDPASIAKAKALADAGGKRKATNVARQEFIDSKLKVRAEKEAKLTGEQQITEAGKSIRIPRKGTPVSQLKVESPIVETGASIGPKSPVVKAVDIGNDPKSLIDTGNFPHELSSPYRRGALQKSTPKPIDPKLETELGSIKPVQVQPTEITIPKAKVKTSVKTEPTAPVANLTVEIPNVAARKIQKRADKVRAKKEEPQITTETYVNKEDLVSYPPEELQAIVSNKNFDGLIRMEAKAILDRRSPRKIVRKPKTTKGIKSEVKAEDLAGLPDAALQIIIRRPKISAENKLQALNELQGRGVSVDSKIQKLVLRQMETEVSRGELKVDAPKKAKPEQKTLTVEDEWYSQQSTDMLKLFREDATPKDRISINKILRERGEETALQQRPGETGFLRFGKTTAEKTATNKTVTRNDVKQDMSNLSKTINTWFADIPTAINNFGKNTKAALEVGRLLLFERAERNRIRGVYNDEVHFAGVQSHRGGPKNLTDAEVGNLMIRDLRNPEGKPIPVIPEGVVGANEISFIIYENGRMKAKPGYEIMKMPGNLIDVISDNATPANKAVAAAAKHVKLVFKEMGDRAEGSGLGMRIAEGKLLPFKSMQEGYFPHRFTRSFFESLDNNKASYDAIVKQIAKREKITEPQARAYINESRKYNEILSAPQHSRLSTYNSFIRDRSAIFSHIKDLGNRIGRAETLGAKDINGPRLQGLLKQIAEDGGDTAAIGSLIERVVGRDEISPFRGAEKQLYRSTSKVLTAMYLPLFAVSNMATMLNVGVRGSTLRLIPAMIHNLRVQNRMRSQITRTGALSEYLTDELAPSGFFAKIYGIKASEQYVRSVSAEVGRGTARDLLKNLKSKNPDSYTYKASYNRLKNLLLKSDEQMAETVRKGKLTQGEVEIAGGRMAEMTQGLVDPIDLPYHWSGGTQNLILDFAFTYKRFAYQSTKILFQSIKENPAKAVPMLTVMAPIVGEVLGDTKAAIKGALASIVTDETVAEGVIREIERRGEYLRTVSPFFKEYPLAARMVDNYLNSWIFGLMSDALMSAVDDRSGLTEFITGPFVDLLQDVASSMWGILNDLYRDGGLNWDSIEKDLTKFIPGSFGSALTRSEQATKSGKSTGLPRP